MREVAALDRGWVAATLARLRDGPGTVRPGAVHDGSVVSGLVALEGGERVGLATYHVEADGLEVVTLDALVPGDAVGAALVARLVEVAVAAGCGRVWLAVGNDDVDALGFWQRHGFRIVAVHRGALDAARDLAPGVPAVGRHGIAVHDSIELVRPVAGRGDGRGVTIEGVAEADREVLANLLQLYRHDLSALSGDQPDGHGRFVYRFLDLYFLDQDRWPWFIRRHGALAGFALARRLPDGAASMAEFFVLAGHRRAGTGAAAAAAVIAARPGTWEVAWDVANPAAAGFWPGVVARAAAGPPAARRTGPPPGREVLRFSTVTADHGGPDDGGPDHGGPDDGGPDDGGTGDGGADDGGTGDGGADDGGADGGAGDRRPRPSPAGPVPAAVTAAGPA